MNEETRRHILQQSYVKAMQCKETVEDTIEKSVIIKMRYERDADDYIKAVLDFKEQLKEAKKEGIITDDEYSRLYDNVMLEVKE